ncbi:MAG TPA: alpha-amylase family protein [Longimicrobium sp.]|nr:alpha-amylase family protein [Longimicrobium sp.]
MLARFRAGAAGIVALALLGGACACGGDPGTGPPIVTPPPGRPALDPTYRPSGHAAAGDVFVHLFEWKWTDIAAECESVLGPAGWKAVQVSPPQEHYLNPSHTWWQRYQPVSYSIERSRSGTRAELIDMVARCRAAGVDIYVDAVINHMTAGSGTGSNGTVYTKYSYPPLYAAGDFHGQCEINNYQSAANVQDCELVGLADLHTGNPTIRQKIADYLAGLARLGVAGFRIDAAKHMQPVELDDILDRVDAALAGEGRPLPYWFGEVIDHGGEAVRAADYYGLAYSSGGAADITEFRYRGVGDKFLGTGGQKVAELAGFSRTAWSLMPDDKAVVFLENHDTQRGGGISYRDPAVFRLANVWMLAHPYGYPSVMSSYAFNRDTQAGDDAGPPSNAAGVTNSVTCAASLEVAVIGQWVCEHRDPVIARMVGFRRAVAGTNVNGTWDNGANAVAFSRGDQGFVAISRESTALAVAVATPLPPGTYCDVLTGGRAGVACVGTPVTVAANGMAQVSLPANTAIAIHAGTRL